MRDSFKNRADQKPIGIFDSGIGGLTVFKELTELMPSERFVYLGDTARVPYGTKSADVVLKYALEDSLFLLDHSVKFIVIACNTASAYALDYLQDKLAVPVVGVIEPGAQAGLAATKNFRVGIIGTEGTIRSGVYEKMLKKMSERIFCHSQAAGLFVPLVEEGVNHPNILGPIFQHYLSNFLAHDIDTLILGCTHYPLLKDALQNYFGPGMTLVDSAQATAQTVQKKLSELGLLTHEKGKPESQIFVTDAPDRVFRIAKAFLNCSNVPIQKISL